MRKYVATGFAVVMAVLLMVGGIRADAASKAEELRRALKQDGKEAVKQVGEADANVQKKLVPKLLDIYLRGGWDESAAARTVLRDLGMKHPKAVAPEVEKRFMQAGEDQLAVRLPLMELLRDLGPGAKHGMSAVVEALKSDDLNMQQQAVWAASAVGKQAKDAVPPLLNLLDSEDALLREDAAEALSIIGVSGSAVPKVRKALDSDDPVVRQFAVRALQEVGPAGAEAVPDLINMVKNADRIMKLEATKALGAIGPDAEEAVPVLLDLAEGKSLRMQKVIQEALDKIKTQNVAPAAEDVTVSCQEGGSTEIKLQIEMKDDTPAGLEISVADGPEHGSLEQTGPRSYRYSSHRGFAGEDTFTLKASDGRSANSIRGTVDIQPDETAPKVTQLAAAGANQQVKLLFSEPLDETGASAEHYAIDHGVEVREVKLKGSGDKAILKTSPMEEKVSYALTITGVKDTAEAGNVLEKSTHEFEYMRTLSGLRYEYHHPWNKDHLPEPDEFGEFDSVKSGTVDVPTLDVKEHEDHFTLKFTGQIDIPEEGDYTFFTTSDDGSKLYIDGDLVVDNGGSHGPETTSGEISLEAGMHSITVMHFEEGGGETLSVSWQGPGFDKEKIPADVLVHVPTVGE